MYGACIIRVSNDSSVSRDECRADIIRSPISDNYGVNREFLMVGIPVSSFVRSFALTVIFADGVIRKLNSFHSLRVLTIRSFTRTDGFLSRVFFSPDVFVSRHFL